jgi:two-component system sensor histidine kinase UhpB
MLVLHVEEGTGLTRQARRHLAERLPGLRLEAAATPRDAAARLRDADPSFHAVVVPVHGPGDEGVELVRWMRRSGLATGVVAVLRTDDRETVAAALAAGADEYVAGRRGFPDRLATALRSTYARWALRCELAAARARGRLLPIVFDALSTRVVVLDRAGTVVYASRSWLEMTVRCGTPICVAGAGQNYLEICRGAAGEDADAARALAGITEVLEGRADRFELEYPCHAPGEALWFLLQATPMPPEQGGAVICHVDVTERRGMEQALRESHERYALAAASGCFGLWDWNLDTGDMFVDPALKALLGYADHEIPNRIEEWGRHVHPDDMEGATRDLDEFLAGRLPRLESEHRMVHRDGSIRWFLARGAAERRPDGTAYRLLGADTDVTERRRTEDELRRSRAELKRLAGRLIVAQEDERRRIARELHDELNQEVAAFGIGISRLGQTRGEEVDAQAARLAAQVERLAGRIRSLSHRMHPAVLEHAGLVPALHSVCEEFGRMEGVRTEFRVESVEGPYPPGLALAVYRVAQEALRNVVRHSGARAAQVTLTGVDGALELVVADRGAGFDPAAVEPPGLGLVSMAERVHLEGGDFEVVSAPGAGTEVRARFPFPRREAEDGTFAAEGAHPAVPRRPRHDAQAAG